MTKWTTFLTMCICLTGVACGRGGEAPAKPAQSPAAHDEKAEAIPGLVRVDPEMLRDLRIITETVESRSGGDQVILLGELSMDERAYAEVAAPVEARVTRLLAHAGETVAVGAPLAELFSADLGRARADYLSASAQVRLAESALTRKQALAAERIAPQREVQEAEAAAAEARAAQRSALAALAAFGVSAPTDDGVLREPSVFVLRSPVRGAIIERRAVVGQMLEPTVPAFRIGDLTSLWLTGHAFERDAVRIAMKAPARISFPALPGQEFSGTVTLVGRQVDTESRTIPIRITVENRGGLLRPGMSATAAVPAGQSGAMILTVPVASVQRVRDEWVVFLQKETGTFESRTIGRGRDLGGEVEVLSGLRAGEAIVVDGAFLLKAEAEKGAGGHDDH